MEDLRGNFFVFLNENKKPGDRRPVFTGKITKPGSDNQFPVSLWAATWNDPQTGEEKVRYYGLIGALPEGADAMDQVHAMIGKETGHEQTMGSLTVGPSQIVLFPNRFRDEGEPSKKRPEFWGGANFGDGSSISRVSGWMGTTRTGKAMMTGETS